MQSVPIPLDVNKQTDLHKSIPQIWGLGTKKGFVTILEWQHRMSLTTESFFEAVQSTSNKLWQVYTFLVPNCKPYHRGVILCSLTNHCSHVAQVQSVYGQLCQV